MDFYWMVSEAKTILTNSVKMVDSTVLYPAAKRQDVFFIIRYIRQKKTFANLVSQHQIPLSITIPFLVSP